MKQKSRHEECTKVFRAGKEEPKCTSSTKHRAERFQGLSQSIPG